MQKMQCFEKSSCICGKCGRTFNYKEEDANAERMLARSSPRLLYGIEVPEKSCPYCGSKGYSKISMIRWSDKFLFK